MSRVTRDTLFEGRVRLAQPARGEGYRVNVDALLLAHFARRSGRVARVAFDLGAGVGAVSLALLHWGAAARAVLVEIDEATASLARENLEANGWSARADVVAESATIAARRHRGEAHLVVCNPPYFAPGRGHAPSVAARSRARTGELRTFTDAARALLARRGRACFVYPARETATLFEALRASGLEPKRARAVRSAAEEPARVLLVEAMAAKPGGLILEPELIERDARGPSKELRGVLAGDVSDVAAASQDPP